MPVKVWIVLGVEFLAFALLLFLSAGTIVWSAGWAFLILIRSASRIGSCRASTNVTFLASVVRIQKERGHKVISNRPLFGSAPSALLCRANHAAIDCLDAGLLVRCCGFVPDKRGHRLPDLDGRRQAKARIGWIRSLCRTCPLPPAPFCLVGFCRSDRQPTRVPTSRPRYDPRNYG